MSDWPYSQFVGHLAFTPFGFRHIPRWYLVFVVVVPGSTINKDRIEACSNWIWHLRSYDLWFCTVIKAQHYSHVARKRDDWPYIYSIFRRWLDICVFFCYFSGFSAVKGICYVDRVSVSVAVCFRSCSWLWLRLGFNVSFKFEAMNSD